MVIVITGGVISGLGKGLLAASIGKLLKNKLKMNVGIIKIDPYLNVDCGTMNPDQHGEVFVTNDGKETDLDIGHYERFIDENLSSDSCIAMGSIYKDVILGERDGEYLGLNIQVIPHLTNAINEKIENILTDKDVVIVEVGGTVGDYEGNAVLYAIKELEQRHKCIHIHLSKLDCETGSIKTKPVQNSVIELCGHCILPDILVVRTYKDLNTNEKEYVKNKLRNKVKYVLFGESVGNIYDLPAYFENQNILSILALKMGISYTNEKVEYKKWNPKGLEVYRIAIAEKYHGVDPYISIQESIKHVSINENVNIEIEFMDIEQQFQKEMWFGFDAIIIPGGFGDRAMENKISLCNYARENNVPILGLCMGMQIMLIEFARNICDIKNATSQEFKNDMITSPEYVVHLMDDQNYIKQIGGTMRLGAYKCNLMCDSIAYSLYRTTEIHERHRHRYEFNNEYKDKLGEKGMKFTGFNVSLDLVEIIEIDKDTHPFFVGVQFHPEFKSRPNRPHPLFIGLFNAMKEIRKDSLHE